MATEVETAAVSVRRVAHNGSWEVCALVDGMLFRRTYYGYSRGESVALFREVVRCAGYGTVRLVVGA